MKCDDTGRSPTQWRRALFLVAVVGVVCVGVALLNKTPAVASKLDLAAAADRHLGCARGLGGRWRAAMKHKGCGRFPATVYQTGCKLTIVVKHHLKQKYGPSRIIHAVVRGRKVVDTCTNRVFARAGYRGNKLFMWNGCWLMRVSRAKGSSSSASLMVDQDLAPAVDKRQFRACVKKMTAAVKRDERLSSLKATLSVAGDAKLSFVGQDGEAKTVPLTVGALRRAKFDEFDLQSEHRVVPVGTKALFLYGGNTVVAADTSACRITGVYMPSKRGDLHPAVAEDVAKNIHVAEDKEHTPSSSA